MSEAKLRADIDAALAAYRANADTLTGAESYAARQKVKKLQRELTDLLVSGAVVCKHCGNIPHAMLKTPAIERPLDPRVPKGPMQVTPPVYEVGCVSGCTEEFEVDGETIPVRVPAGRGHTAPTAVDAWNALQK